MPRSIEIAFLRESRISSALELIRRVLQPTSRSLPHITLRHSNRTRQALWPSADMDPAAVEIMLDRPATFDSAASDAGVRTVLLSCSSDALELRSYKPDFPGSVPHITLYDGPPSRGAAAALRVLGGFPWRLKFEALVDVYSSSKEALVHSSATDRHGVLLTDTADDWRRLIFAALSLGETGINDLSDFERLSVVEALARAIHREPGAVRSEPRLGSGFTYAPTRTAGQLAFWTPEEVWSITGAGPKHRRAELQRRSAYATPPELARDVAQEVARYAGVGSTGMVDFGDPALGSGILYAAVREALGAELINSARLIEIDPTTALSASQRLAGSGISVLTGDFLNLAPEEGAWSLLLANPPYRRSQDIAQDLSHLRAATLRELGITVSARADMYVYFLLRAHAWLRQGAIAGWIIPSEFQVTAYGAALRNYLSTKVQLLRVHTYDSANPLFDNALTSTSVVIYRKVKPDFGQPITVTFGGTLQSPQEGVELTGAMLSSQPRWSFAALNAGRRRSATSRSVRIEDLFTLRRGIATGANSYFILSDEQLAALKVDPAWVRPIVPRPRDVAGGVILSDPSGNPIPPSGRWLIDTAVPLRTIRAASPRFAEYLDRLEAAVGDRHLVARRPTPFKQEARDPAPFLFVYMARYDSKIARFIANESNAIHLNNLIGMHPKPSLWMEFSSPAEVLDALLRIQAHELEEVGRIYGKGLLKLEPRELGQLRMSA